MLSQPTVGRGMSRLVTLVKGKNNMIGISIGGGAPFCPVLYVVQVSRVTFTHTWGHCYSLLSSCPLPPSFPSSLPPSPSPSLPPSFPPSLPPQVFHRTPAYDDGSLCPGDELVTVNSASLRGLSRKQTADMIQSSKVRMYVNSSNEKSNHYCMILSA